MKLYITTNQAGTRFQASAGNTQLIETADLQAATDRLAAWLEARHEQTPIAAVKLSRVAGGVRSVADVDATNIHVLFAALFAPLAKGPKDISATLEFKAEPAGERETFAEYLARVGKDQAESGREFTARDYEQAAARIAELEAALFLTAGVSEHKLATLPHGSLKNLVRDLRQEATAAMVPGKVYLHLQD